MKKLKKEYLYLVQAVCEVTGEEGAKTLEKHGWRLLQNHETETKGTLYVMGLVSPEEDGTN